MSMSISPQRSEDILSAINALQLPERWALHCIVLYCAVYHVTH
jgi:hypothetical protein